MKAPASGPASPAFPSASSSFLSLSLEASSPMTPPSPASAEVEAAEVEAAAAAARLDFPDVGASVEAMALTPAAAPVPYE